MRWDGLSIVGFRKTFKNCVSLLVLKNRSQKLIKPFLPETKESACFSPVLVFACFCLYLNLPAFACICICLFLPVFVFACFCLYLYLPFFACICICLFLPVFACICICLFLPVFIFVYVPLDYIIIYTCSIQHLYNDGFDIKLPTKVDLPLNKETKPKFCVILN